MVASDTRLLFWLSFLFNDAKTYYEMTGFTWVVWFFRNWSKKCSKNFVILLQINCQTFKWLHVSLIPTSFLPTRYNPLFINFRLDANVSLALLFHSLFLDFCLGYFQIIKYVLTPYLYFALWLYNLHLWKIDLDILGRMIMLDSFYKRNVKEVLVWYLHRKCSRSIIFIKKICKSWIIYFGKFFMVPLKKR